MPFLFFYLGNICRCGGIHSSLVLRPAVVARWAVAVTSGRRILSVTCDCSIHQPHHVTRRTPYLAPRGALTTAPNMHFKWLSKLEKSRVLSFKQQKCGAGQFTEAVLSAMRQQNNVWVGLTRGRSTRPTGCAVGRHVIYRARG